MAILIDLSLPFVPSRQEFTPTSIIKKIVNTEWMFLLWPTAVRTFASAVFPRSLTFSLSFSLADYRFWPEPHFLKEKKNDPKIFLLNNNKAVLVNLSVCLSTDSTPFHSAFPCNYFWKKSGCGLPSEDKNAQSKILTGCAVPVCRSWEGDNCTVHCYKDLGLPQVVFWKLFCLFKLKDNAGSDFTQNNKRKVLKPWEQNV